MLGSPGGDLATHGAGTDHMDMGDAGLAAAQAAHLLAQEEDANEIARSVAFNELGEALHLGLLHGRSGAPMLLPQVDQGVRGGILCLGGLLLGLLAHLPGREAAGRLEREGLGLHVRLTADIAVKRRFDGGAHMALLADGVDQADRFGPAGRDRLAGQHQGHGFDRIGLHGRAIGAAEARMQAEHHFGKAELGAGDRDAPIAGHRQLQAATHAMAVQDRDRLGLDLLAIDQFEHRPGRLEMTEDQLPGPGLQRLGELRVRGDNHRQVAWLAESAQHFHRL